MLFTKTGGWIINHQTGRYTWFPREHGVYVSNPAHRVRKFPTVIEEDRDMKQVSYDYCCMRDKPGMESAKILVSKDRATHMVSAHVVPLKGAVLDWVIQQCARDLERLGHYGQVTLKSDQEAAIVDVLREIAKFRGSRGTLLEHSQVADSQSNGLIERGIRSVEEMTRVLLFDLSSRVSRPISVHSPVFSWIVEHATAQNVMWGVMENLCMRD